MKAGPPRSRRTRSSASSSEFFDLGRRLRELRRARSWTLEEIAVRTGIARSTLSKIENNQMSPTFDVLQRLAGGFEMDASTFVARADAPGAVGRRCITRARQGQIYAMKNYHNEFLAVELSLKKFTPMRTRITARTFSDFPEWIRHPGEDFVFVLSGEIEFHSECYSPARLSTGDSAYFDSMMGHVFISVSPEDAEILWVTAS